MGAAIVLSIVTVGATARARAWSAQGHRLVALIADQRLTPVARRNVVWLLGPETLADVSSWADRYHDGVYQTFFWHFLNIPAAATGYDRDRDCPRQPGVAAGARADQWRDCAVDRIPYHKTRLADPALDRADRAIALKFLVHLVGDLHQPFHALGVGHGGNDIPVIVFGSATCGTGPCNLHGVWDGGLIAHRNLDDAAYLQVLRDLITKNGWERQSGGTPADWAMQSHDLAKAALLPEHGQADEAYYRAHIDVVDRRLALAGVRLAAALNDALTQAPPE
ncbi:MAG: S1/P1 nuclease [Vicinamibacterales bacterium]